MLVATASDIDAICHLVYKLSGISLDSSKGYLIESRLADLIRSHNFQTYAELASAAESNRVPELKNEIINRMVTGETLFFRDRAPFDALEHKVVPNIIDARELTPRPNQIRIWSAGCSTGQEPYSIAMVLAELIPDVWDWDITILATDISDENIQRASQGIYPDHQISRGLPDYFRSRYFVAQNDQWRVKDSIRSLVRFERLNLMESFSRLGQFDIVFCRNVAIYFTPDIRRELFDRFADALTSDGYLFVGSAEALTDLKHRFAPEDHCRATIYRPLSRLQTSYEKMSSQ